MNWLELTILFTNGMLALWRWIDLVENRHNRKIQLESQKMQKQFNAKVTEVLEKITPQG